MTASSMSDLTERLREVPKGQGHSFPSTGPNGEPCRTVVPYGNMMHLAADALETLTQENARLREALEEIAVSEAELSSGEFARGWNSARFRMRNIARKALGGGDEQ